MESVHELAEVIVKQVGGASRIEFLPLPADDPRQRKPDIALAIAALGWQPKVTLADGLAETISYFKHILG